MWTMRAGMGGSGLEVVVLVVAGARSHLAASEIFRIFEPAGWSGGSEEFLSSWVIHEILYVQIFLRASLACIVFQLT